MIVLIGGASHSGKTLLAQKLLEKYKITYLSIDHIKMGLIRSKLVDISVYDDAKLMKLLWPIVTEIIKTAIENDRKLIIEGIYIPLNYREYFSEKYLEKIDYYCLIMSEDYINNNFDNIIKYQNVIEKRLDNRVFKSDLIAENKFNLRMCQKYQHKYILIDKNYDVNLDL